MNSATAAMLDGIKEACTSWGRAMRWVLSATGEGYPNRATFERAREGELDAKAISAIRQRFGEVMLGDALAVSRAIRNEPAMPEDSHRVLFMHYVVPPRDAERIKITIAQKSSELGFRDRHEYYQSLDKALYFLMARIPIQPVPRETISVTQSYNGVYTPKAVVTPEIP